MEIHMGQSFYYGSDAQLLSGAQAMSSQVTAAPTAFGLVAAQATALATATGNFASAYAAATSELTRTRGTVAAKNSARTALRTMIADFAKIIDGTATVTDQQRLNLGLSVRKPASPIPVPSAPPALEVKSRIGTTVFIKLHDGTGRRAKPAGVQGARVYTFVGPVASTDPQSWIDEGQTTKSDVELNFPVTTAPGTIVWITAAYYNPRGQLGPACEPVRTNIAGGAMNMAA